MADTELEEAVRRSASTRASRWPNRKSANRLEPECWPEIRPGFQLKRSFSIFTIGSCFARNVEAHLAKLGFNVPAHTLFAENPALAPHRGELLNKYTPPSIYQELTWAKRIRDRDGIVRFDDIEPLILDLGNERFIDMHSQIMMIHSRGLSRAEALTHRQVLYRLFSQAFDCEVAIITLGLIECWLDRQTGQFVEFGDYLRRHNENDRFAFRRLTYREAYDFTKKCIDLIGNDGQRRVLITTSPIALSRTFTNNDVIVANMHSKSVLRAVAGEIADEYPNVEYFPSFESVMLTRANSIWRDDLRHVEPEFIGRIMIRLSETYLGENEKKPNANLDDDRLKVINLVDHGQFEDAREIFDRLGLPDINTRTAPYVFAVAEMHSKLGKHDVAQDLARKLRAFAQANSDTHTILYMQCARIFDAAGNADEGASTRRSAFENLSDPWTIRKLLRWAMKRGAQDDVNLLLAHAERQAPGDLELLKSAARYYSKAKDFAAAARVLRALAETAPEDSEALCRLSIMLAREEKAEEAVSILELALMRKPNDRKILESLVETSLKLKRRDAAEHYTGLILSVSPEDPSAHAAAAVAMWSMHRNDEALAHARRAAELDPLNQKYNRLVRQFGATKSDRTADANDGSRVQGISGSD